jgi:hypothetical protein
MAKITSDFLWLASAMEGWVCATLLLEYLQADVGVWIFIFTQLVDDYHSHLFLFN